MNETSHAIVEVKREVQLVEWQRQIQERQEQGLTVDEWCENLGISKGAYYHRLRKVREYMCKRMGVMDNDAFILFNLKRSGCSRTAEYSVSPK